jgi:hypothetical protein
MDTRFSLHARARVKPLALSLALVFAGATASQHSEALSSSDIDTAIPKWMSPVDSAVFKRQLLRMAAHAPSPVPAVSIPVTNCDDSGSGSLRDAVNAAVDGDTIDMTGLSCSTITLTSGAISIGVGDLTIQGPGALFLTIDGGYTDRVLWHIGTGTLTVSGVTVSHGNKYLNDGDVGNAGGGCVFSAGTLAFEYSWAKYCKAGSNDTTSAVHGGALYAQSGVFIDGSIVTGSQAYSTTTFARGGGVYTPGDLTVIDSTISGNTVSGNTPSGGGIQVGSVQSGATAGGYGRIKYSTITSNTSSIGGIGGGGAYFTGNAYITNSTISGNEAGRGGGVYFVAGANATAPAGIYSSTVSGNTATFGSIGAGGVQSFNEAVEVKDTTIAFNNSLYGNSTKYGAGIHFYNANTLDLQNTIVAGNMTQLNSTDLEPDDIGGAGSTVTGANNLVYFPDIVMPSGTLLLTDPMLRALAGNGGATATHMPNFGSPVIDVGNNASGATVDQRGVGYPRIVGPAPDIGAVEFDLSDEIFANGFD